MINRKLYNFLIEWKIRDSRLPLILRGARQVGKTTLINTFSVEYDQYLYFNLEKKADKDLFVNIQNLGSTIQLLFLAKGVVHTSEKSTLKPIDQLKTRKGKTYHLLNLPYFLSANIDGYLEWFIKTA